MSKRLNIENKMWGVGLQKTIKISETLELILSNTDFGYQKVLDSFKTADMIRIVTYNISPKDDSLLEKVEELQPGVDVKIITNIPNRFANYYNTKAKERAKQTITSYMDRLNPENYATDLATFFNFGNHSKIIMTDSIAYIGSANYSSESSDNFECGILISDRQIIDKIEREFFYSIQEHSKEFRGTEIARIYIRVCDILSRLELVTTNIRWSMYTELDPPFHGIQYKNFSPELSIIDLVDLEEVIEDFEQVLVDLEENERYNNFSQLINADLLVSIREHIEIDSPIYLLADFDEQKYAEEYMEENSIWADEDNLGRCANQASQKAADKHSDLAMQAESKIEILLSTLNKLIEETTDMMGSIGSCEEQKGIDNTSY